MTKVVLDWQHELTPDAVDTLAIAANPKYADSTEAEKHQEAKVHKVVRLIVSACDRRQRQVTVPAKGWPK
jgi:hypothetical protein